MTRPFQKVTIIFLPLIFILSSLLTACERPVPETIHASKEQQTPSDTSPDLNAICENLKKEMLQINAQRTTLALEQVNQDLRMCLSFLELPEQKKLMQLSEDMYQQFLEVQRTPEQQKAFEMYALDQSLYPTIQQSHFEQLNIRDQYLLKHKGQAYVELIEQDKNQVSYRRSPQYLAKVFAPYLPDAESEFIEELARQNLEAFEYNDRLKITTDEIIRRAQFWEEYQKRFPSSSYVKDAQYLNQIYTALLFKGLDESPLSERYDGLDDLSPTTLSEIKKLAQQKNSVLADQARKFIIFMQMSHEQRQLKIPLNHPLDQNTHAHELTQAQLSQYLNLKNIDFSNKAKKDCFSDAVCQIRSS